MVDLTQLVYDCPGTICPLSNLMTEDFNKDSLKESYSSRYEFYILISRINGDRRYSPAHSRPLEDCFVALSSFELKLSMGLLNAMGVSFALLCCAPPILAAITQETRGEKIR